jgi:GGDEF domain-containing protein
VKRLRFWVIATLGWFFILYNIERISAPINLASFVYLLTAIYAILIIAVPWLQKISLHWMWALPLPLFFALKIWFGYRIAEGNLPVTITEIFFLGVTAFLARGIGLALEQFREAGIGLVVGNQQRSYAQSFETGQGEIYREIQRARLYKRPLSLLAVSAKAESVKTSLDRLVKESQDEIIKKYVSARLANFLLEETNDCDVVTQRDNHFVIVLPEISQESVADVIARLESAAKENLGLELSFGVSTFPDEEVTFEKLLECAETEMWEAAATLTTKRGEPMSPSSDKAVSTGEVSNKPVTG